MQSKPSYEELERRVEKLEQKLTGYEQTSGRRKRGGIPFNMFHRLPDVFSPTKNNKHRLLTANALRQSEDRFRSAFQTSPDSVSIIRVEDERFVDVNAGFSALTGHGREDVVGRFFREIDLLVEKKDREKLMMVLRENGSVVNMESRFRLKNGRIKTGLISAMIMTLNREPHVLFVIRDIDRIKRMEEALEVSEARFRELFNSMTSGVVVCRVADSGAIVIVDLNRAAERIEGVDREKLKGKNVLDVFPKGKGLVPVDVLRRVWRTGKSERCPVTIVEDDGPVVWKENTIFRLPSGEIIIVCDDISDRKKAEEKLLAYQKQLLSLASELSLAEERERRSIATDLHDQIGQTLSFIKIKLHNLRTKLLQADCVEDLEEIQEYLTRTIRNTRSLTFELSPPILYELGLEAALEWLCEEFQNRHGLNCSYKNDGLAKPLGEDVGVVLFRSVRELLTNVVKHAAAQNVHVSVLKDGSRIKISLQDNGIGFDARYQALNAAQKHAFGLFNIRERLRHLGGEFSLHAKPGRGTCVTLMAPLKPDNQITKGKRP